MPWKSQSSVNENKPILQAIRDVDDPAGRGLWRRREETFAVSANPAGILASAPAKPVSLMVDRAEPGFRPVRPNEPLTIGLGCGVGVILAAIGVALIFVWVRRARPSAWRGSWVGLCRWGLTYGLKRPTRSDEFERNNCWHRTVI